MDLAAVRARHGWTQADLAGKLKCSPGHVGDIERGHRRLTVELAARLEQATGETGYVAVVAAEIAKRAKKKPRRKAVAA